MFRLVQITTSITAEKAWPTAVYDVRFVEVVRAIRLVTSEVRGGGGFTQLVEMYQSQESLPVCIVVKLP